MTAPNKIRILINEQAGTVQKIGRESLTRLLGNSGLNTEDMHFLTPEAISDEIAREQDENTLILLGGGDGTVAQALPHFQKTNRPFGILPLGTMNLLAKDLRIPANLVDAAAGYAKGYRNVKVDLAYVNDRPFLCCASLGTMPKASQFREEHRAQADLILLPRLTLFILSQLGRGERKKMVMMIDRKRKTVRTPSLVISNNTFAHSEEGSLDSFKRETLQNGELGVYVTAPRSLWDSIRFLLRLGIGGWKKDGAVREYKAREVRVFTGASRELVSVDGENMQMNAPFDFVIKPRALSVCIPDAA